MKKRFTYGDLLIIVVVIAIISMMVNGRMADAGGGAATGNQDNALQESNNITQTIRDNVPVPRLVTSSERKNVAKRAELFNNEEKISYIYLVSYGKVMAFFTVQGKVSSLQSYMTPTEKMVFGDGTDCNQREIWGSSGDSTDCYTVSAPDIDGTYGENVEGIFFFTTDGAYVEWKGEYMMSDQPLKLATPPALVREIN